jgi:hypothetical protein
MDKNARIEKLRESKPIALTGSEIADTTDFLELRKCAKKYGYSLRNTINKNIVYINDNTGMEIIISGGSIDEILEHDYKDVAHLQSIAAIPAIIKNAVFICEYPNADTKKHRNITSYQYYIAGLRINITDYTVKMVVSIENKTGKHYYDHKLTQIEKGALLSSIQGITSPSEESNTLTGVKDKRLLQILQDLFSARRRE